MPPQALKTAFERLRWHNAPSFAAWQRQVADVRVQGFAVDDGNYINGVHIVASPILGADGEFRHAIVALCIREGWSSADLLQLANTVRDSALQVAEGLQLSVKSKLK